MTIPNPRIFPNDQNLPMSIVLNRLQTDPSVDVDLVQSSNNGTITNSVVVRSGTLTNLQITNALAPAQTAPETTALTTKTNSRASKSAALVASNLLGTNISAVNSNSQRDALMKAICMALSICDENGVIVNI